MSPQKFNDLLAKWRTGNISAQEAEEFILAYKSNDHRALMEDALEGHLDSGELKGSVTILGKEVVLDQLRKQYVSEYTKPIHRIHFLKTTWFRYAAAAILILSTAAYFWSTNEKTTQTLVSVNKPLQTAVAPAHHRAILTLANGRQLILDSTQGNIVKQGRLTVVNLAGKLRYEGVGTNAEYNTISTPKGAEYQIILPDGSKVWLNAASSIKFPTAFTASERNVEITGEAYMEIAQNSGQPFLVKANGAEIQVLGTSFNVNAYEDEDAVKTTLIDGSVKVISRGNSTFNEQPDSKAGTYVVASSDQQIKAKTIILKPGEQSIQDNVQLQKTSQVDIALVMAWKNGLFVLQDANLEEVTRQLARWYDIDIRYEGTIPTMQFGGKMDRSVKLSTIVKWFTDLGIPCHLEQRTLIIGK